MTRTRTTGLWMVVAVTAALVSPAAAADPFDTWNPHIPPGGGEVSLTTFKTAPVLDGKIEDGEWDLALRIVGFQGERGRSGSRGLEPRRGYTMWGFTGDKLYIAIVSELPPDGELITRQNRNEVVKTVSDDSVEIWFANSADLNTQYQMIGNSGGAIFDIKHAPEGSDQGWNAHWQMANGIDKDNNVWVMEVAVPFADFGLTGDIVGKDFYLLTARNYKRPWTQATSVIKRGSFRRPSHYAHVHATRDQPVVQVMSLGEYGNNAWGSLFENALPHMKVRIVNPGPARKAKVKTHLFSTDMPEKDDEKILDLPANGTADYDFTVAEHYLHPEAQHSIRLTVSDAQGNADAAPLMDYGVIWQYPTVPIAVWDIITGPQPELASRIAYYPSYAKLRVEFDPAKLADQDRGSTGATVTVTDASGKTVFEESTTWEKAPVEHVFSLPELAAGEYVATTKFNASDMTIANPFRRQFFPWEGVKMGVTDEVLPPFTPITVDGDTVGVVLRKYEMTGLGLWKSVQARGHDDDDEYKELLAGPIELVANGDQVLEGTGAFTTKKGHAVVYEGSASSAAVGVKVKSIIEEDGAMRVEMTLEPGSEAKAKLNSLVLRIPMRNDQMPLYHVVSTTLRTNPAGFAPAGEGKVWTSDDYPDGTWYDNFHPYVWFGGPVRGLSWFADNDKNWVLDKDKDDYSDVPSQELHRDANLGVLTLQLNLVQKPTVITAKESQTIVFGLMASPGKPMPERWRAYGGPESPMPPAAFSMPARYGALSRYGSKAPLDGDFSMMDVMQAARLGYPLDLDGYAAYLTNAHPVGENAEWFYKLPENGKTGRQGAVTIYFDEFIGTSIGAPESPVFFSEWCGRWMPKKFPTIKDMMERPDARWPFVGAYDGAPQVTDSYIDYATWHAAQWLRRGIGCYFDNSNPRTGYDPITTSAYRLPTGEIQPSAGIWARREYMRRIWTLHQQLYMPRTPQYMFIHMTNTHVVPYMTWNMVNGDLEWKYGPEPMQTKFTPEVLMTESLGRQTGTIPSVFTGDEEVCRVFEIHRHIGWKRGEAWDPMYAFGYGKDDCTVVNFWDDNPPIQASDDRCKWLLLLRGGEAMLVLTTWNPEDGDVTFTLDSAKLGLSPREAVDVESGEALQMSKRQLTVPLTGYGERMIRIR